MTKQESEVYNRMLLERDELTKRTDKLDAYLSKSTPGISPEAERNRALLMKQRKHMHKYLEALNDRIELFESVYDTTTITDTTDPIITDPIITD